MIEKNKNYTYEELKEIITNAEMETIKSLSESLEENGGEKLDSMGQLLFNMQTMLATNKMAKILLGEDK